MGLIFLCQSSWACDVLPESNLRVFPRSRSPWKTLTCLVQTFHFFAVLWFPPTWPPQKKLGHDPQKSTHVFHISFTYLEYGLKHRLSLQIRHLCAEGLLFPWLQKPLPNSPVLADAPFLGSVAIGSVSACLATLGKKKPRIEEREKDPSEWAV